MLVQLVPRCRSNTPPSITVRHFQLLNSVFSLFHKSGIFLPNLVVSVSNCVQPLHASNHVTIHLHNCLVVTSLEAEHPVDALN